MCWANTKFADKPGLIRGSGLTIMHITWILHEFMRKETVQARALLFPEFCYVRTLTKGVTLKRNEVQNPFLTGLLSNHLRTPLKCGLLDSCNLLLVENACKYELCKPVQEIFCTTFLRFAQNSGRKYLSRPFPQRIPFRTVLGLHCLPHVFPLQICTFHPMLWILDFRKYSSTGL